MIQPTKYTYLAFELNHNLEHESDITIAQVRDHISDRSLFTWLRSTLREADLSILRNDDEQEMLRFFGSLADTVDEERKFGIEEGGLNLLLAYCIEALQQIVKETYKD